MYPATLLILSLITGIQAATVEHWWNISYAEANPDGAPFANSLDLPSSRRPRVTLSSSMPPTAYKTPPLGQRSTAMDSSSTGPTGTTVRSALVPTGSMVTTTARLSMDSGRPSSSILGTVQAGTTLSPGTRNLSSSWLTGTSALSLLAHARRYHEEYPVLERRDFLNWVNPTGAEPVPDSAVIYGAWKNGTTFSTPSEISAGTGVSDHASLLFTPGKSYRIHMVNMGGLAMFWVALQDHQVYIIEADGVEVEPLPVDAATFSVAQRYSLWVQAKDTGDRNYALYDTVPPLLVLNNTVQVVYNASAPAATAWIPSNIPTFNDTQLVPLHALPLLQPDVKITLNAYFEVSPV
ncbi:hypothetical protein L204_104487 [Cryptococcus depauperatus]